MLDAAAIPDRPPDSLRFKRSSAVLPSLHEVWQRRELVLTLTGRDFIARYKQTFLGFGWSILQPLAIVLAMSLFLRRIAANNTHGTPYLLWSFVGLVPWSFLSGSLSAGLASLLANQPLLNKVRCPRLAFPYAGVALVAVDTTISLATLGVMFAIFGIAPAATVYWVPLIVAVQLPAAFGVAALAAIIVVYLRDLRNVLPLILQLGLFVTPIAFGLNQVPAHWRLAYCFLNPVAPVIDSYRRVVLYGLNPVFSQLAAGATTGMVLFIVSIKVFKRLELGIADLI